MLNFWSTTSIKILQNVSECLFIHFSINMKKKTPKLSNYYSREGNKYFLTYKDSGENYKR